MAPNSKGLQDPTGDRPTPPAEAALFGEKYARKADAFASTLHWQQEAQCVYRELGEYGKVLDLGCNTGRFIEMFSKGNRWVGMDVNPHALEVAASRLPDHQFIDFEGLRATPSEEFDAVAFIHAINQVQDLDPLMSEVWRVMKRGARIVVMTHNPLYSLKFLFKNLVNGYRPDPTMVREPRLGQLVQLMYEQGFQKVSADYQGAGAINCMKPRLIYVGRKA